jgi:hypothetical protein
MTTQIDDANELLRAAVAARREAQAAGKPHEEWYGGNAAEMPTAVTEPMPEVAAAEETEHVEWDRLADEPYIEHLLEQYRLRGDGLVQEQPCEQPGSLPFLELLEELRQLHFFKTAQYGGAADPFENVTASAKCGVEPWRRALCDLSDCVVRMQRFANGQPVDYENALIDAANWSLICLLKLREAKRA